MSQQSFLQTTATGSDINFTITTFSSDEILVYVDGVKKTAGVHYNINPYNSNGQSTVAWIGTNPSSPSVIRVVRQTDVLNNGDTAVEGRATYQAGASVKADDLNNNQTQVLRSLQEHNDQLIQTYDIEPDAITSAVIADSQINSEHYVDGSIDREHLAADIVDGTKIADDSINSEHYVNGSIDEEHIANSAVTSNKIANNAVTTTEILDGAVTRNKLATDAIDGTRLADNAIDSEHYTDGSIDRVHLEADIIDSTKLADNAINSEHYVDGSIDRVHLEADIIDSSKLADDAVGAEHIQANAVTDSEILTGTLDNRYFTETELTNGALDGRYFTETESDARYFNIASGETIKDGDTFPDNDTTIATTAAINDRIIDLIDDVGGFDIIQSEQHFPNTNPQGTTGQAAVLSIKEASTNLVPSGTTVTISNGNLANNANITITGVTSTIPTGFGFLVESTSTTHTYAFHRLVPKATEVTTVASNISNINAAANNESNINAAVSNASNINAAVSNASNITAVAGNASNINAAVSNASNINSAVANASNINTTAGSIANVNNVGTNIAKVNSVAAVIGGTQTFTITVQNVSGSNYFFVDGQQSPALTLARGFTYTFDVSDSSNYNHPLRFKDGSGNSYTTGVTVSGTQGQSGATVVIAVAANAPSSLRYYCTVHGNGMGNTITVTDDNIGIVAGSIGNVNTTAGSIANVNTTAGSISNVNTVASNISNVNSFFNVYRIGSSNPTSSLDVGDLFFNTTSNSLKVYTGSAWVDGVTATGNFAVVTGNTFTGSNNHNDNVKSIYGNSSDLEIFHDGNFSRIKDVGTGDLVLQSNTISFVNAADSETVAQFKENGSVDLYYDNSKKLETTSYGVLSNEALKVNGSFLEINNNADSQLTLNKASTQLFSVRNNSTSSVHINTQNSAILALGVSTGTNNGSVESHLQILAGGNVRIPNDSGKLQLGASQDLEIFHDGSNSYIEEVGTGSLITRTGTFLLRRISNNNDMLAANGGGSVELFYDGSKKFETDGNGITVQGNINMATDSTLFLGVGNDFKLFHNGTTNFIRSGNGNIQIDDNSGVVNAKFIPAGATELYHNGSKKLETTSGGVSVTGTLQLGGTLDANGQVISFPDSNGSTNQVRFGTGDDLRIYHQSNSSYIINSTGNLNIGSNNEIRLKGGNDVAEHMGRFIDNGAVQLYYDNSLKFQTTSGGIYVTGAAVFPDGPSNGIQLGNSSDLQIYHDGSNSYIKQVSGATGDLLIFADGHDLEFITASGGHSAIMKAGGAVELSHNNVKKFETTSYGNASAGQVRVTSSNASTVGFSLGDAGTGFYNTGSNAIGYSANGTQRWNINSSGSLTLLDNVHANFGTGSDLQIYHDGSFNFIRSENGHPVNIIKSTTENIAKFIPDGAVELYYDNAKKIEAISGGAKVTGVLGVGLNPTIDTNHSSTYALQVSAAGQCLIAAFRTQDGTSASSNGLIMGLDQSYHYVIGRENRPLRLGANTVISTEIDTSGHLRPTANNSYDLGASSRRWRNVYTNDLNLSNEGGANDVDGTWGDWTIQEGESDLFLKNNRSGKKYKFNLTEVS